MGAGAGQMGGMRQMMPQIAQMAARTPSRQSAAPSSGKGGGFNAPQPFDPNSVAPGQMTIDQFARSGMMGPTTQEARNPVQFEGKSYDPALVSAFQNYRSGASATPQPTQMGLGSLAMQRQQTGQTDPGMMQMMQRMQAMQQQGGGIQAGPTPGQPANPFSGMSQQQLIAMNQAMDRERQMNSYAVGGSQNPYAMAMNQRNLAEATRMATPQPGVPGPMQPQVGQMTPGQDAQMVAQLQQEQVRLSQMPQDPRIAAMAAQQQGQRMAPSPFQGAKGSRSTQPQMQQNPMTQYYRPMAARTPSMAFQARMPSPAAPVRAPVQTPRPGGRDR